MTLFLFLFFFKKKLSKYVCKSASYNKIYIFLKRKWSIYLACIAKSYIFASAFQEKENGKIEILNRKCEG